MADAADSKSADRKVMGVQVPPPAPNSLIVAAAANHRTIMRELIEKQHREKEENVHRQRKLRVVRRSVPVSA
jgi:hypothetical protein